MDIDRQPVLAQRKLDRVHHPRDLRIPAEENYPTKIIQRHLREASLYEVLPALTQGASGVIDQLDGPFGKKVEIGGEPFPNSRRVDINTEHPDAWQERLEVDDLSANEDGLLALELPKDLGVEEVRPSCRAERRGHHIKHRVVDVITSKADAGLRDATASRSGWASVVP